MMRDLCQQDIKLILSVRRAGLSLLWTTLSVSTMAETSVRQEGQLRQTGRWDRNPERRESAASTRKRNASGKHQGESLCHLPSRPERYVERPSTACSSGTSENSPWEMEKNCIHRLFVKYAWSQMCQRIVVMMSWKPSSTNWTRTEEAVMMWAGCLLMSEIGPLSWETTYLRETSPTHQAMGLLKVLGQALWEMRRKS